MGGIYNKIAQQAADSTRYQQVLEILLPYLRSVGGITTVKDMCTVHDLLPRELTTVVTASRGVLEIGYVYNVRERYVRSAQGSDWRDPRCHIMVKITHTRKRTHA